MERRRTDRKHQLEMVLASIFLAYRVRHNTCSYRTSESLVPAHNINSLGPVKGPELPQRALIGTSADGTKVPFPCANPVNGPSGNRTRNIISGHEFYLALVFHAVNALSLRVLWYLEGAEDREPAIWFQQDIRLAWVMVALAAEGNADPYVNGFIQLFHKHPSKVTWWWRDDEKLWRLAQVTNCPTPLLVANRAEEALGIIPDFDYSTQVSPVRSSSRAHAHPANHPAPRAPQGSGAGTPRRTA